MNNSVQVIMDPNETIISLCGRLGYPIHANNLDPALRGGTMTVMEIAKGLAVLRDERAEGETTNDGVLVDPLASLSGWLGYGPSNATATSVVANALFSLVPPPEPNEYANDTILTLCQRLGHPINPDTLDPALSKGQMKARDVAKGFARVRNERLAGQMTADGVLVDPLASLSGWLGYGSGNMLATTTVASALIDLIPKSLQNAYLERRIQKSKAGLEHLGFVLKSRYPVQPKSNGVVWLAHHSPLLYRGEEDVSWTGTSPWYHGRHFMVKWGDSGELSLEQGVLRWLKDCLKMEGRVLPGLVEMQVDVPDYGYIPKSTPFSVMGMEMLKPMKPWEEPSEFLRVTTSVIARRLESLLETLDYCHTHKVVHADVCPDHVLLRPERDTQEHQWRSGVLIGFGVANCTEPGVVPVSAPVMWNPCRGKTPFMSPESLAGTYRPNPPPMVNGHPLPMVVRWQDDPKLDSWGAGTVLASWLSGLHYPFGYKNKDEVLQGQKRWVSEGQGRAVVMEARRGVPGDREGELTVLLEIMDGLLYLAPESRWTVGVALQHLRARIPPV